jgi:hypothetical protein
MPAQPEPETISWEEAIGRLANGGDQAAAAERCAAPSLIGSSDTIHQRQSRFTAASTSELVSGACMPMAHLTAYA